MAELQFAARAARLGTESAFTVLARAGALAAQGRDVINLGIGQPDFATPAHIVEAGVRALRDGHHGYTPAGGLPALREAVAADLHRRHGAEVSPDTVVIVPGGKPTMFFAISLFGEAGAEILYPDPGFPIYESVIRYSGARPVPVPAREETGFALSAEDVLARITPRRRAGGASACGGPVGRDLFADAP
jgi:aspartate/methionine/tyrosine aminotransferase